MITAVDIGATKTLIAQFGDDGQPKNPVKFPTAPNKDEFITELFRQLEAFAPITTLSVGVPGVIEGDGVINSTTNLVWVNWPLKKLLQEKFDCPVYIQNDAHMAAIGEINSIDPLPHRGLYLTVSTGIGGGLVVDGKLPTPVSPTEFGTMVFEFEGKMDIWEHFASGKALFKHFGKKAQDLTEPEEWQWLAERLSVGLLLLIPQFEPDVVVFGGGVGRYLEKFRSPLEAILAKRPVYSTNQVKLLAAKHPEEAVIYGCYYYATHQRSS